MAFLAPGWHASKMAPLLLFFVLGRDSQLHRIAQGLHHGANGYLKDRGLAIPEFLVCLPVARPERGFPLTPILTDSLRQSDGDIHEDEVLVSGPLDDLFESLDHPIGGIAGLGPQPEVKPAGFAAIHTPLTSGFWRAWIVRAAAHNSTIFAQ